MVKITFQSVPGLKPEKDEEGEKTEILIPHPHVEEELVLPVRPRRSSPSGLCCLTFALLGFTCSLIYASIYIYHYYIIPQAPAQSRFHCRVVYEESTSPRRARQQQLEESVGIYLHDNYEHISIPVPDFGSTDPADIIHDFHRGLTAYHDIALDKCYVIELNSTIVMPPRNLWELLVNVKKGTYLPQTYMVQEEMVVSGRVYNMQQLGPFISRLCNDKDTYRLRRRGTRRRISKRGVQSCHHIRHFENTFVVETVICDTP